MAVNYQMGSTYFLLEWKKHQKICINTVIDCKGKCLASYVKMNNVIPWCIYYIIDEDKTLYIDIDDKAQILQKQFCFKFSNNKTSFTRAS